MPFGYRLIRQVYSPVPFVDSPVWSSRGFKHQLVDSPYQFSRVHSQCLPSLFSKPFSLASDAGVSSNAVRVRLIWSKFPWQHQRLLYITLHHRARRHAPHVVTVVWIMVRQSKYIYHVDHWGPHHISVSHSIDQPKPGNLSHCQAKLPSIFFSSQPLLTN